MLYLIFQILFFLLIAALLGFVIGWLLRGSRFQSELQDLDARWRTKLGEVEGERDRFAGEVNQANEARAKFETSAAEARRLAETNESSLQQLRKEHQTKLGLLSDMEGRASGLEKELASAKASLVSAEGSGGDNQRLSQDLAAATSRTQSLERELQAAKEANGTCKREVDRLQAEITALRRSGGGAGSGAGGDDASGTATGSSKPLGLVGGTDTARSGGSSGSSAFGGDISGSAGQSEGGYTQQTTTPSHFAETGSQGFVGKTGGTSGGGDEESEGVRPEALTAARGGVADDLKKISGVGPKLEKTLHGLGIFHFSQIADFTRDNVAWVDRHLRFKGRIDRENWIEQAKILAAGGETEFSQRKK